MQKVISVVTGLLLSLCALVLSAHADDTWEFSVQVSASVQSSPPQITLSWPQDVYIVPNSYTVYRKAPNATSWGPGTTLPGTTTSYVDSNVSVGTAYEYQIVKVTSQYTGYGYIYAGSNIPMTENRGKLLLVVDNTYAANLANELARLQQDLVGDGWTVIRHDVGRNDSVPSVKSWLVSQYNADPANVKTVFLFGHVPVPYSGDIVPDGHVPDHQGAWPCDGFYGDMTGVWTDTSVNDTGGEYARNHNVPGDGKYDQSSFPAPITLMVGRVDLANMPGLYYTGGPNTFPSEQELLRNYLNKDHRFRTKQFDLPRRGISGDFFGVRNGEAFAASAYRNFAPFFGANNITTIVDQGVWAPTLTTTPYLWAGGFGAGSFGSIGGLGNSGSYNNVLTTDVVNNDLKFVFGLFFGSWLGDWDSQDNIMRSVLATPSYGLACAWSGRPHFFLQHMGLGETIGYGTRLTQNNGPSGLYQNQVNTAAGNIHVALMGDPTLRMHIVAPPSNLTARTNGSSITLSWTASADSVLGYHVYRANASGTFTRLTTTPLTTTTYTDNSATGAANYMVRALKLETSGSGTYYNPSLGAFLTTSGVTSGSTGSTGSGSTGGGTTTDGGSTNPPPVTTGIVSWVDDALPAGATGAGDGGDTWNWVASNPTAFHGSQASQSTLSAGLHQHYFYSATATLAVNSGDTLFAYVYLDPANPPSEVMLQWNDGASWEHRAYWGANNIAYGTSATTSRTYMGPLPAAGQWAVLQVPAKQVALEGSTVSGMAFSQYDGRATWDYAGKSSSTLTNPPPTTGGGTTNPPTTGGTNTNSTGTTLSNLVSWVDDALPTGATAGADGGDAWSWISSNPTPFHGSQANQSTVAAGLHQHFFYSATSTLAVNAGDTLFAYVYLDPANPPSEVMLQWNNGSWEHRAYWGANSIAYGTSGTTSRAYMGPLPATGQWVLLQVPASQVALEGSSLSGMAFSLYGGRATWDYAGKASVALTNTPPTSGGTTNPPTTGGGTGTTVSNVVAWADDVLPTGATGTTDSNDPWTWVGSNPAAFHGSLAHQSSLAAGLHQHFFTGATATLGVNTGDSLFTYVYLDPANVPSEIMLQWNDGSWEHRAYWGANTIAYGVSGSTSRAYMGPLPATGQWALLQVSASQVALEGSTVSGMAFTLYNGRATWDYAGKSSVSLTNTPPTSGGGTTNPPTTGDTGSGTSTNTTPPAASTNVLNVSAIDYVSPTLPKVGDNTLHVLSPKLLELKLINTKQLDPAQVAQWNLVNSSGQFVAPALSAFKVTANGQAVSVTGVGFKRRPLFAPLTANDLRIENSLYLQLSTPLADTQTIQVTNPDGSLWSSGMQFTATVDPQRYSPAIHVNQEGYVPAFSKKAMVGYYLGSLGEMTLPSSSFKLVNASSGAQVYQGTLVQRTDSGFAYTPTPYQKVYEADFTAFTTPGEYRLVVPGMGASLPFMIYDAVAMSFARAYALGLYHQRCGTNTAMPYTRYTHDVCHAAPVAVPTSAAAFPTTWSYIANYANTLNPNNPTQQAPALTSPSAQLFPYVNQGPLDVSGGHHDAGDYSKYTINSASLIGYLMFAADSLPGVAALDNLGLPESGDGISDVMQEAKWEADFLAKMQDKDGGFYFLVYPQTREYEGNVTPDHGDPQLVWPKTTSVTAASVAALAKCASSPWMKQAYPAAAALYLQKAKLGWQFLMNAVNKYGKNGAYQKITHYGDNFADNDELAWAACEMYLATGDPTIHQLLLSWFNPADPATWHWGWWHMCECYGHAIRSYAFAVQSGRATASQLDASFLSKCKTEIAAAGDSMLSFSQQNAYGTSFPTQTKAVNSAGWYFSCDQAFDMAVAYQLNPKADYMTAMLANMNFEGGCNPLNLSFITGLGYKRQRDIVSQWHVNADRVLPPSGLPVGNIIGSLSSLPLYGSELEGLCFPSDSATTAPCPFYDRWADSWNVTAEMVVLNQARGIGTLAFLAAQTSAKSQTWKAPANAQIVVPTSVVPVGSPLTVSLKVPGLDLSSALITWEARDQEPAFGSTFTFSPVNNGVQWVEAEAEWPDGRRAFAKASFTANSPNIVWVEDAVPAGATAASDGGDSWTWVSSNPAPFSGRLAHQSALAAGEHQHFFSGTTATMVVGTGDTLYAYAYLDPSNPPTELMLQWNDGSSWDHRAYWGANSLGYGADGTTSRRYLGALPAAGQWVQLKVPASQVGLEGSTLSGMAFTAYGGRVTWDAAGRLSTSSTSNAALLTPSISTSTSGTTLSWPSTTGKVYQVSYKNQTTDATWSFAAQVTATGSTTTWVDKSTSSSTQRFYQVMQTN
jgi:hypothetical protein